MSHRRKTLASGWPVALALAAMAAGAQDFPPDAPSANPVSTTPASSDPPVIERERAPAPVEDASEAAARSDANEVRAPATEIASDAQTTATSPTPASEREADAIEVQPVDPMPAPDREAERTVAGDAFESSTATPDATTSGPPELVPAGDPGSLAFVGPPLVPPFAILGDEVLPGAVARLEWNASQTFAGGEVVSPVVVVHGTRPGPVLCLTAAIHGDELNGVEIVRRTLNGLDPAQLSGTVVGVPIVNLFGFSRNSRYLPDRRDLNRYFPGARFGSIASRIAYSFFENVVRRCDALVDFHTGSFDRSNLPQIRADLRIPDVLDFTRGFGATAVLHSDGSRGMLRVAATEAGIPAVTFEVGAPTRLQPDEIAYGEQAIDTLMHKLGMTRELPTWEEPQPIFYEALWIRANAGGMLISQVQLGDSVEQGQILGHIIDPLSNIERRVISPVTGTVLGMALNQVVLPGYATYHLGERTSEQGAVLDAATAFGNDPVEEDAPPQPLREDDPDLLLPDEYGDEEFED